VAKTITLHLSPQIIVDFQSCFDNPQSERKHLYDTATQRINQETGEVFIKKTLEVTTIENGKKTNTSTTLDEIEFEKTEIPTNPQWITKEISGKLEEYEYLIGDSFWIKITNWSKLNYILNHKYNTSMIKDAQSIVDKLKTDGKMPDSQIKRQQEQIDTANQIIEKKMTTDCIEAYVHILFSGVIIEKIKSSQQQLQDKEFAELNKVKEEIPIPNTK